MKTKSIKKDSKIINFKFNLIAIICISIFIVGIVGKTLQNDTYYTITLGKYILNNGIDMMEHFAWHEGLIYTYPHWLYDVFIYLIYSAFGFNGIYISSIILGIVLGLSIYFVASKISKNNLLSFFVTLLIMFLGREYITARAQLVTFILFVWTIYFIERFLDIPKIRYAIGLILIPIAIANVHAAVFPFYFILFLPYIGEYIIALLKEHTDILTKLFIKSDEAEIKKLAKIEQRTQKQEEKLNVYTKRVEVNKKRLEEKRKQKEAKQGKEYKIIIHKKENVKWLILVMIICAFTGLVTPIGDTPYTYLLHTMQGNTTGNINEHLPLILSQNKNAIIIFAAFITLVTFTKVKVRLSDLFLAGGLIILTFMSRRQLSMVLFIGVFALNNIISDFIRMYDDEEDFQNMKYYITTWIGQLISYALVTLITVCLLLKSKDTKIVNDDSYPVEACDYIVNNLDVDNIKLFNDYNYGSYLMYRGIPVFIDSRADVYDPKFNGLEDDIFQDYISLSGLNCYYENKFEHYGITHVMTYSNSKLALYISKDENYKELYRDEHFVIFERL